MEALVENSVTKVSDWESALKMIKTKGRDAEKLARYLRPDAVDIHSGTGLLVVPAQIMAPLA